MKQYQINCFYLNNLTNNNNHTEARLYIAKMIEHERFIAIFNHILQLQNMDGSLNPLLADYRIDKTKEMMEWIKKYKSEKLAELLSEYL